jgi:2-isopropylmalate synthase
MWWAMVRPVERLMVRRRKRRGRVYLSDTTLRDGEQMAGVRLGPDAKLAIARALAEAGIDSIDAGFPAASAEERDAIRRIVAGVRGPVVTALCRTATPTSTTPPTPWPGGPRTRRASPCSSASARSTAASSSPRPGPRSCG